MTELRELFEELAAAPPPTGLTADSVYAAGRRRRRVTAMTRVAAAVVAGVLLASGGYAIAQHQVRPAPALDLPGGPDTVIHTLAVDGNHLYATLRDCRTPDSDPSITPTGEPSSGASHGTLPLGCHDWLVGSDDGGRTWTERSASPDLDVLSTPRRGKLVGSRVAADLRSNTEKISTDGGRSWRPITRTDTPIAEPPANGWVTTLALQGSGGDKVLGVDPTTGRAAPLANQPPFGVVEVWSDPSRTLIVAASGISPTSADRGQFAISRDNGRTWSTRQVPQTAAGTRLFGTPETVDGVNLYYALPSSNFAGWSNEVAVSHDGGATWVRAAIPAEAKIRTAYLTRDGAHILIGEGQTYWISRDQGAHYETFTGVSGLQADADGHVGWSPGGYVLEDTPPDPSRGFAYYRSADGLTWKRITIG